MAGMKSSQVACKQKLLCCEAAHSTDPGEAAIQASEEQMLKTEMVMSLVRLWTENRSLSW